MKKISEIFDNLKKAEKKRIAVAAAADTDVLQSVCAAYGEGIADVTLVGGEAAIKRIADEAELNIDPFEIVDVDGEAEAAEVVMRLAASGEADMVMKGLLPTAVFLKTLLDAKYGLRRENGIISSLPFFEIPYLDRFLFISDPGFIPAPDIDMKIRMIENAIPIIRALGIDRPNVAVLCASEAVNPKMQSTVDAQELQEMCEQGIIKNCEIMGPVSLDLAISETSAAHKGFRNPIAGKADLLLAPNIEAANIFYKTLTYFCDFRVGGIMTGARVPIIFTSRSDSPETKLNTIAVASYLSGHTDLSAGEG
jgi:phosphate butyryltransferase